MSRDLLPGFAYRAYTCAPRGFSDPALPALCDRSIVGQVEVRTRLGLNLGYRLPDREGHGAGRFLGIKEADLVFFTDLDKAWLAGSGELVCDLGRSRRSTLGSLSAGP